MSATDLGRLAATAPDGTLQNSPVGFSYNDELGTIDIVTPRRIISFGIDDTDTEAHLVTADARNV